MDRKWWKQPGKAFILIYCSLLPFATMWEKVENLQGNIIHIQDRIRPILSKEPWCRRGCFSNNFVIKHWYLKAKRQARQAGRQAGRQAERQAGRHTKGSELKLSIVEMVEESLHSWSTETLARYVRLSPLIGYLQQRAESRTRKTRINEAWIMWVWLWTMHGGRERRKLSQPSREAAVGNMVAAKVAFRVATVKCHLTIFTYWSTKQYRGIFHGDDFSL